MDRIVIVEGLRTPYLKAGSDFRNVSAIELGRVALHELLVRTAVDPASLDEVIIGNVSQPVDSANPARVVALRAGIAEHVPARTVQRNCASGMEAVTSAFMQITAGEGEIIAAGGLMKYVMKKPGS